MRIEFPSQGLHEGLPATEQPVKTSFLLRNVRPFDVTSERIRGGQRPGTTKAYSTHCGVVGDVSHPIIAMVSVVSTYIPAVSP